MRLATAHHLDAVDRVERVLVIEQRPVAHVDQRLHTKIQQLTITQCYPPSGRGNIPVFTPAKRPQRDAKLV